MKSYSAVHKELWKTYGKAKEHLCTAFCGRDAEEWAFVGEGHDSGCLFYSENLYEYTPLCKKCHFKFDDPDGERATRRGKIGGPIGGKRAVESGQIFSIASMGGKAASKLGVQSKAGKAGGKVNVRSGHIAALGKINGPRTSAMKRLCIQCGMVTNPGNMKRHQSASGHQGHKEP